MNVFDSIDLYNLIPIVLCGLIAIVLLARVILYDPKTGERRFQNRSHSRSTEDQRAITEGANGQPIIFSGDITPSLQEEAFKIYLSTTLLYRIVFFIAAIVLLIVAVMLSAKDVISFLIVIIMSIALAIAFLFVALRLPQLSWRSSWLQYTSQFGPKISGEIYPTGVRLSPTAPIVSWNNFVTAEMTATIMLLYFSRTYAYPIHRSMVKTDSDWQEVISISKRHIRNFKRRG